MTAIGPKQPRLEPPSSQVVAERLDSVRKRIEAVGRDPDRITIVAVTKGFTAAAATAALAAGVVDIGENYSVELLHKAQVISGAHGAAPLARWHYLGAIQRRRIKDLAPVVDCWQTVCRVAEGEAVAARAGRATLMVEVETTGLPGRNGCPPHGVGELVRALRGLGLEVRGLMTVGPNGPAERSRTAFRTVARLGEEVGVADLSMGMSDDLEVALEEGATMIRVGRALFGDRGRPVQ